MSTTPKNENVETLIYVLKDPETTVIRYKSLIFGDTKLKINYKELPTFQVIEKSVQDKNGEG